ncbi:ABC transporter permease subunit [Thioflexithrix psekupsensis]|uniref:Putrescine ABC transporter permease PotH n=1 Tax=Thioflexithrix psekupsensis TaxID=1570016 RepID=A0A251X7G8_9GAMM|nr:ABC transporter permease subunit [Thioflexithrix psekupsensis]OUD14008.1 putrescine ABC transporter permease PotH [Thioflexithrix psekupsensis]
MNKLAQWRELLTFHRFWVMIIPYSWFILFFVIPFFIVLKISFSEATIAVPPYEPLLVTENDKIQLTLNLGNYHFLFTDALYINAYLNSLQIAFFSTLLCLLIGYPMAYAIAHTTPSVRNILLLLIILPSWTSFLIRVYAWIGILKNNGLLNNLLLGLGIIDEPIQLLYNNFAIYVGIVYAYLPFMVLPLYTNLVKHDPSLLEAAADLGARPLKAFFSVTLPLSKAGIIAGSMLVFIPVMGEFVIPELLGGPDNLMIGKILWQEFFNNRDWPIASAVTVLMLLILLIPIIIFHRSQLKQMEK